MYTSLSWKYKFRVSIARNFDCTITSQDSSAGASKRNKEKKIEEYPTDKLKCINCQKQSLGKGSVFKMSIWLLTHHLLFKSFSKKHKEKSSR